MEQQMAHTEPKEELVNEGSPISPATLLTGIVRSFVDDADQVQVESLAGPDGSLLTLRVANADFQKVMGTRGRTARCLHTVVAALGKRLGERLTLDIQPQS